MNSYGIMRHNSGLPSGPLLCRKKKIKKSCDFLFPPAIIYYEAK